MPSRSKDADAKDEGQMHEVQKPKVHLTLVNTHGVRALFELYMYLEFCCLVFTYQVYSYDQHQ